MLYFLPWLNERCFVMKSCVFIIFLVLLARQGPPFKGRWFPPTRHEASNCLCHCKTDSLEGKLLQQVFAMASFPMSPATQGATPMYSKTASLNPKSPAYVAINPNDDEAERRRNREQREAAQRRLLEFPAVAPMPQAVAAHGFLDAAQGMSKERVMALYQNCIKLAAENVRPSMLGRRVNQVEAHKRTHVVFLIPCRK